MPTRPRATVALLLAALLAALAVGARCQYDCTRDQRLWYQPCDLLSFNVATGDYSTLLRDVHGRITSGSKNLVRDKVVLRKQTAGNVKPPRWLLLELVHGRQKITLAIRQDNLYITGFTDACGQWYIFKNRPGSLIPGASVFRVDDDYGSLVAGYRNLAGVRASRLTLMDATAQIADYRATGISGSADVGCVSRALAIMAVTFAEASRLQPVATVVTNGFNNNADGADIGEAASKLVVQWKRLSCAVLIARQSSWQWDSVEARELRDQVGIRTLDDALGLLQVVLWPNRCSVPITGLVEQSTTDPSIAFGVSVATN